MNINKIYIFDDASEGEKTKKIIDKINLLIQENFWNDYLAVPILEGLEIYIRDKKYQNGVWGNIEGGNVIGDNDFTDNLLNSVLNNALESLETAILIDYYLIDNPTGDTQENALTFIKDTLKRRIRQMSEHKVRILFYSAWPNPQMTRTIQEIQNPNIYYTKLDFRSSVDIVEFDLEEFFRNVRINEGEE